MYAVSNKRDDIPNMWGRIGTLNMDMKTPVSYILSSAIYL